MWSVSPYLYDVLSKVHLYSQRHEWDVKEEYCMPFRHWERLVACFTHSRILENYRDRAANITKYWKICSV